MKKVIVVALVSIIGFQAAAQSVATENESKSTTTSIAAEASDEKISDKGKTSKSTVKKSSVAVKGKSKKANTVIVTETKAEDKTVTLSSQSEHKAKSTFAEMLEKRLKADAAERTESTAATKKN